MLASLLYLLIHRLLTFVSPGDRSDHAAQIEILVLRHQLKVLRRQVKRPIYRRRDRALLPAASRILPRDRLDAFLVCPETLLRWHRSLVAHKWTRPHRPPGRPAIDPGVTKLILQMASENPALGLPAGQGRTREARDPCLGDEHRDAPSPLRCRSRPSPWSDVASVSESAGRWHPGLRFLHGRDSLLDDALRPVLHRDRVPARARLGSQRGAPTHHSSPSRPETS